METTTQTLEKDPEIEALKGKVPGLEESLEPVKPASTDDKPKDDKPAPTVPDKKAEEDANVAKGLNPDGTPKAAGAADDDKDKTKKTSRPEKYIPIIQYTAEKQKWQGTIEEKDKRIAELEGMAAAKPGSDKLENAIKAYAEKYGVDEDSARELITIVREQIQPSKEEKKPEAGKLSEEDQTRLAQANEIVARDLYNKEFKDLALPELSKQYPNATPEQFEAAKEELEKMALTEEYLDKSLDYIVFKERASLDEIFAQPRKGPDTARQAPSKGVQKLSADDFKDGKTPFETLASLPSDEQAAIIDKMDLKSYEKYMNWVGQNDGLVVTRRGKKLI